jgi:hypothetical protein
MVTPDKVSELINSSSAAFGRWLVMQWFAAGAAVQSRQVDSCQWLRDALRVQFACRQCSCVHKGLLHSVFSTHQGHLTVMHQWGLRPGARTLTLGHPK